MTEKLFICSFLLVIASVYSGIAYAVQDEDPMPTRKPPAQPIKEIPKGTSNRGGTASGAKGRRSSTRESGRENNRNSRPVFANLTISANPSGSAILLNGREYHDRNGRLTLTGLRPDTYTLIVRKPSYDEYKRTIKLAAGQSESIDVILDLSPGNLSITPSVAGAEITVTNMETNLPLGNYQERISNVAIKPGRYHVMITKEGYRTMSREVIIKPAESVYLEPRLEPQPLEKKQLIRTGSSMSIETTNQGKYLLVVLTGSSGDTSSAMGTLDVAVANRQSGIGSVSGMLPGGPCQIDFIRVENVAEYSFIESPGISNQWGKVIIRIRSKDSKRPIRFSINWRSVQRSAMDGDAITDLSILRTSRL